MKKALSAKEALFCEYYKILGSAREAAARSGYSFPEKTGLRLLRKARIRSALADFILPEIAANEGLRRLAFGSVCDAVHLCLNGPFTKEELEALDLYCISELKISKGGAVEVKFFDRIKALSLLSEQSEQKNGSAEPFYRALLEGARNLKGERDEL